jgi:hypothetical protein
MLPGPVLTCDVPEESSSWGRECFLPSRETSSILARGSPWRTISSLYSSTDSRRWTPPGKKGWGNVTWYGMRRLLKASTGTNMLYLQQHGLRRPSIQDTQSPKLTQLLTPDPALLTCVSRTWMPSYEKLPVFEVTRLAKGQCACLIQVICRYNGTDNKLVRRPSVRGLLDGGAPLWDWYGSILEKVFPPTI